MKKDIFNEAMNSVDSDLIAEHMAQKAVGEPKRNSAYIRVAVAAAIAALVAVSAVAAVLSRNEPGQPGAESRTDIPSDAVADNSANTESRAEIPSGAVADNSANGEPSEYAPEGSRAVDGDDGPLDGPQGNDVSVPDIPAPFAPLYFDHDAICLLGARGSEAEYIVGINVSATEYWNGAAVTPQLKYALETYPDDKILITVVPAIDAAEFPDGLVAKTDYVYEGRTLNEWHKIRQQANDKYYNLLLPLFYFCDLLDDPELTLEELREKFDYFDGSDLTADYAKQYLKENPAHELDLDTERVRNDCAAAEQRLKDIDETIKKANSAYREEYGIITAVPQEIYDDWLSFCNKAGIETVVEKYGAYAVFTSDDFKALIDMMIAQTDGKSSLSSLSSYRFSIAYRAEPVRSAPRTTQLVIESKAQGVAAEFVLDDMRPEGYEVKEGVPDRNGYLGSALAWKLYLSDDENEKFNVLLLAFNEAAENLSEYCEEICGEEITEEPLLVNGNSYDNAKVRFARLTKEEILLFAELRVSCAYVGSGIYGNNFDLSTEEGILNFCEKSGDMFVFSTETTGTIEAHPDLIVTE